MVRLYMKPSLPRQHDTRALTPGLGPGIHVFPRRCPLKTWMAGTSPATTTSIDTGARRCSVLVALRLFDLAELGATGARRDLAVGQRAFLGEGLGRRDRPAGARRAGFRIERDGVAFTLEGPDRLAQGGRLGRRLVVVAALQRRLERIVGGLVVDRRADRDAVADDVGRGADRERAVGARRGGGEHRRRQQSRNAA